MTAREEYSPGPARGAQVRKEGEMWTLILVREVHHAPEKVWQALTDPVHLREWAPFEVDGSLATAGATVNLKWAGNPKSFETKVTKAERPRMLEYGNIRWELDRLEEGTRLTLWHSIGRRYVTWGAAGWHICFDVLDHLLNGDPIGRIAGADATRSGAWQRLVAEYAEKFEVESAKLPNSQTS